MVNVLNKSLDWLSNDTFSHALFNPRHFVADQCLLEHRNQRAVSRKKYSARLAEIPAASRNIESDQRLSRARHTGHEDDRLPVFPLCAFNDSFHGRRGNTQVCCTSVVT